jgi:5-methylcytosine-specific restriction protein A
MRVCSIAGCPNLYQGADSRCPTHTKTARAKRTDNAVYSTAAHKRFRMAVLQKDPICVLCNTAESNVADHYPQTRRELVEQELDPNDPQYGRGLCAKCHNAHTAATSPGGWNDRY